MPNKPYNPLHGMPRPEEEHAKVADFETILEKVDELFESQEYAVGVELFAKQLDALEKAHPDSFSDEKIQKSARRALAQLWKSFVTETHSPYRRGERISSEDAVLEEDIKHLDAHTLLEKGFGIPALAIHSELYQLNNEHTQFTGTLYNDVLPLITEHIQAYLAPLLKGDRGYSSYRPVSGNAVRAIFIPFLQKAPELARILSEAFLERDKRLEGKK